MNLIKSIFEITATSEVMIKLERLFAFMHNNGGHSGLFAIEFDGDGSDYFKISPEPREDLVHDAHKIAYCTNGVEVAFENAFYSYPIDRNNVWRVKDGKKEKYNTLENKWEEHNKWIPTIKEKMVTITEKEYKKLINDAGFLQVLREFEVDNWEGYSKAVEFDEAMANYQDYYEEEEL
jgi:hypothetical protein